MEINAITLENGIEYLIIETVTNNFDKYLFLVNENDETDMCVRKVINKEGKDFLVKLDNDDEFEEVLNLFCNKYKGEIK